jgi:hypothetical protein
MMTLTANTRAIKTTTPITLTRRPEAARTVATTRPAFWRTLLRALSAAQA